MPHKDVPGRVWLSGGRGGMPRVEIETPWSRAEIYLHGAQVVHFQKQGEPPLLFLSERSEFRPDTAIRGGVPIVFPWFGSRKGLPSHGTARTADWTLEESTAVADGSVTLRLALPQAGEFSVELALSVSATLEMELRVSNRTIADATFENCLHSYFHVADVREIAISGLVGADFFDKTDGSDRHQASELLTVDREVDRVYFDTESDIIITDPGHRREIRLRKSGSQSTVVWNPWTEKSRTMSDLGDGDYLRMVCVESGNIGRNSVMLPPGGTSQLRIEVESRNIG